MLGDGLITAKKKQVPNIIALGIPLMSGGLLALATFIDHWFVQLIPFFCIVPLFVLMRYVKPKQYYGIGLFFFAAWLLPTTYWYYSFMPMWLAFLASVGYVTLIANLFHFFMLRRLKQMPYLAILTLFGATWVVFTGLRLRLPVLEDWWLPHLGYAVWRNEGVLQLAHWGGEVTLEASVLIANIVLAAVVLYSKRYQVTATTTVFVVSLMGLHLVASRQNSDALPQIITLQQMTLGGVDVPATNKDIENLEVSTVNALQSIDKTREVIVVWPENSIPEDQINSVHTIAKDQSINLLYHTVEVRGGDHYKKVVLVNGSGEELFHNYKQHIAPGEVGSPKSSSAAALVDDTLVTAYVCYDMHYPDSVQRIGDAKLVLVPINDAAFSSLQRDFHKADLAIRAVQTRASIVSSSTNGPTVYVNQNGSLKQWLPYDKDDTIFVR